MYCNFGNVCGQYSIPCHGPQSSYVHNGRAVVRFRKTSCDIKGPNSPANENMLAVVTSGLVETPGV